MTVTSQSRFKWNDDKLINLKKSLPEFESSYVKFSVLGQLPPPSPKTNPNPNPNGGIFPPGQLSGCPPTLKLTLTLTETPTLSGGQFFSGTIVRILSRSSRLQVFFKIGVSLKVSQTSQGSTCVGVSF